MKFNYQARTKEGEIQSGVVEASSKEAALSLLQKLGFFVTYLEKVTPPFYAKRISFFRRISSKEIVLFFRQMAIMLASKISLIEALRTLGMESKNPDFAEIIFDILEEVEAGMPLSLAFSRHPKIFSSFCIAIIQSGERAGKMTESFKYLAESLEREYHLASRLKGAMIYPVLILLAALSVIFLIAFFILPSLTKVLVETETKLPMITKIIIGFAQFLRKLGWVLILGLISFFFLARRYYQTKEGRNFFDRFFLKLPLIGSFLKILYLSRFAENLSTLISAGIPITQALEMTADIVGNTRYREAILKAFNEVKKGEAISSILASFPDIFSPIFIQMVVIGEKTGTLDRILLNLVNFYQKEIERDIESLLSILEPSLIIFLGVIVGGLIASVLLPLYQMPLGY